MPRMLRRFLAALLTLTVLLGAAAAAAGASPMAHGGMAMSGNMPCDERMPMPPHDMPCGHECCLCILGFTALASGPGMMIPAGFFRLQAAWRRQPHPNGLTLEPALPPPIA